MRQPSTRRRRLSGREKGATSYVDSSDGAIAIFGLRQMFQAPVTHREYHGFERRPMVGERVFDPKRFVADDLSVDESFLLEIT